MSTPGIVDLAWAFSTLENQSGAMVGWGSWQAMTTRQATMAILMWVTASH
jgi:hypothetical protein